MTITKTQIYLRSIVFFFLILIRSGTLSVIPQLFLLNNYPKNKNSLLGLILVLGTISAIFGLRLSAKVKKFKRAKTVISLSIVIVTILLFSLFLVQNLVAYFLIFCLLNYAANFIYNYVDQYFIKTTPDKLLKLQVNANIKYQLLGVMTSPFYFSFVSNFIFINISAICVLGFLSAWFATWKLNGLSIPDLPEKNEIKEHNSFTTIDWLFTMYAGCIFTGVVIFSSILIYVLKDYYLFSNAKTLGAIFIGLISIVAIMSVQIHSMLKKPFHDSDNSVLEIKIFSPYLNFVILGLFLIGTTFFSLKLSSSVVYLITLCCVVGCGYGLFLSITREYASKISIAHCKPKLLSTYNNLANYASLAGFSILMPVSLVSAKTDINFCSTMLYVVKGFFLIGVCYSIIYLFKSALTKN